MDAGGCEVPGTRKKGSALEGESVVLQLQQTEHGHVQMVVSVNGNERLRSFLPPLRNRDGQSGRYYCCYGITGAGVSIQLLPSAQVRLGIGRPLKLGVPMYNLRLFSPPLFVRTHS
jgi:hypothetical protein